MIHLSERERWERAEAWLGLSLLPGWGPIRIWKALGCDSNPVPVWRQLRQRSPRVPVAQTIASAKAHGVRIITWDDCSYPPNLRHIAGPPAVLYTKGSLLPNDRLAIAVVGSRRASPQATQLAFILARDLAALGITIVSGLAMGIDAAAHRGALAAGGRTAAVLAGGVESVYPRAHAGLAEEVAACGALISQFPCGTGARRTHFPVRNRTLAGLALATVVVEAPARSGALITADYALDHGRDVFVCPGDPTREHTQGSNGLLREGARAIRNATDLVEDLYKELKETLAQPPAEHLRRVTARPPADTPAQPPQPVRVWQVLQTGPATADEVARRLARNCSTVRSDLTLLEMQGYVQRGPGDVYRLVETQ
ncbi:MAG: DNA-processing protein DprA [Limnochordia bacterium]